MTITFDESMTQSRSKIINIPNLQSVVGATSNTGNASFSVDGENVSINVSNGTASRTEYNSRKYSKSVSDYKTSSSNSFPSSMSYNSGGYSGPIYKNGSSYIYSGSPANTKKITGYASVTKTWTSKIEILYNRAHKPLTESTHEQEENWKDRNKKMNYSDGIYSGTLYLGDRIWHGYQYGYKEPKLWTNEDAGRQTWRSATVSYSYSGTVYKPDTRQWRQNYSGRAYKGGTDYYYSYTVTIEYLDNQVPNVSISQPTENEYFV